jgi:hypothetical protein
MAKKEAVEKKPVSLKIKSKREKSKTRKSKTAGKKALVIKIVKLNRTMKKARGLAKKALKTATKGSGIARIPERLYKHVDLAIAKSPELLSAIQAAVVAEVNALTSPKAAKADAAKSDKKPKAKRAKKVKKEAKEPVAAPAE